MDNIRKLLPFVRPYWRRAVAALLCLTTLVVLDLSIPRLIQRIIDQGIRQGDQTVVLQTAALMIAISIVSAVIAIANNNLSVRVGESVARDLREAQFLKIQSFSFGNLDRQRTGQLMVRLTSDTSAVQRLVQVSLRIGTRAPLLMIGSLILMVLTSPSLALKLAPVLLVTMLAITFFIVRMEPLFRSVQARLDRLNTVLQENIAGARVVKAFARAGYEEDRFEGANEEYTDHSVRVTRFMSTMSPALTIFVNIGMVVVIWSGGLSAIRGEMTVGQIVAFTNYLLTTMTPLIMMTMLSQAWSAGFASTARILEVLETEPEVQDAPDARPLPHAVEPQVRFERVGFRYNAASNPVLRDITLLAEPGQTVAILGATGSGKSSLVNLIPRFYDAEAGRVLVDRQDVRNLEQRSLHAAVGIAPQESVLFSGTVRDNIRYGRPDATDEEVIAAAQAAQAHAFIIRDMPQGYDSLVAARGANLSGGQKQRIAIARALLTRPKILILDDATSAVDVETETKIQDALAREMSQHTTFIVAQRISTVLKADKIIVLDRGEIVAEGTHAELLARSPIYREIYDSQLGGGLANGNGADGERQAAETEHPERSPAAIRGTQSKDAGLDSERGSA